MRELPKRKSNRLREYDYSQNGAYFITFCTEKKRKILCRIVGDGVLDVPKVQLSKYGEVVKEQIEVINVVYENICIDKYVIMPNHVHLIVFINAPRAAAECCERPSPANAAIPQLVSAIKRLSNRRFSRNIWQRSYYDHVIRDEHDYLKIWNYIDGNPAKWQEDCYFPE